MNPRLKSQPRDPFKAMRVGRWMRDAQHGRWQLRRFKVTDRDYEREKLTVTLREPEYRRDMALRRVIPPGKYVSLRRRMTWNEKVDAIEDQIGKLSEMAESTGKSAEELVAQFIPEDRDWTPVMSDTPVELEGHRTAIEKAEGNVLITGLGLGCLVAGLLVKPGVKRIDVVDLDPDVIALTSGYYLDDPRVHLHVGSAADPATVPPDLFWDYAWHDIWTHIASRNLNDATAEHGISYDRLFELYADRVLGDQDAWAYEEALEMRDRIQAEREEQRRFVAKLRLASEEEQVAMLLDKIIEQDFPAAPITDALRALFDIDGKKSAHLRERLAEPGFLDELERIANLPAEDPDPIGNPNSHLEAA